MLTTQPLSSFLFLSTLLSLLSPISPSGLYFTKSQTCLQQSSHTCKQWNNTIQLYYSQGFTTYMCFPAGTKVIEEQDGIKNIEDVEVGDRILGYDGENGRDTYVGVLAWLHRDVGVQAEFVRLEMESGMEYLASGNHYIGYNDNGTINFKYAQQMQQGDQLITIDRRQIIKSSKQRVYEKGLYSPLTSSSNFYILPYNSQNKNESNLILVHCLADIDNPLSNQNWIHRLIAVADYLGINQHKNQEYEQYVHPITHLFGLFGSYRHNVNHRITISQQDLDHLSQAETKDKHRSSSASSAGAQRQARKKRVISFFNLLIMLNSLIIS